jgi:DNA-binding MarR family transcriptional regulator
MNISLTQLEYILAIDTYRHFAKAADACLVTQPTLSMQLKKLEEELKIEISTEANSLSYQRMPVSRLLNRRV